MTGFGTNILGFGSGGSVVIGDPICKPIAYTGNGSTQGITGAGFQPDAVWIKNRDQADTHGLFDDIRGATKYLKPDAASGSGAEVTDANSLTSFDADGFSVGTAVEFNTNTENYVAWCLLEDAAVFDIVQYTGNGTQQNIAHSMSVAPEMMLVKNLASSNWATYHKDANGGTNPETYRQFLNVANGESAAGDMWDDTAPTSSVFSVGTNSDSNANTATYAAYLFASSTGVSKVGTYSGTGSAGNTVNVGFQPSFVMVKRRDSSGGWEMYDNARGDDLKLEADIPNAESADSFDITATGFTLQGTSADNNASGGEYIYLALA